MTDMQTRPKTPAPRRKVRPAGRSVPMRGLIPLVALLFLWQLSGGSRPFFPPPSQWLVALVGYVLDGRLITAIGSTLWSFLLGLVAATIVGVVIGYIVGRSIVMDRLLGPLLEFFRFTPSSASLPVVVMLLGYEEVMKVFVVVFGGLWPILLQTRAASKALSRPLLDLATSLSMSRTERLRKIIAPALVPAILLGIKIATPTLLVLVLLVEITTNVPGIGRLLAEAQGELWTANVYGVVVLCALLAMAVNAAVVAIEGRILRYRPQ